MPHEGAAVGDSVGVGDSVAVGDGEGSTVVESVGVAEGDGVGVSAMLHRNLFPVWIREGARGRETVGADPAPPRT